MEARCQTLLKDIEEAEKAITDPKTYEILNTRFKSVEPVKTVKIEAKQEKEMKINSNFKSIDITKLIPQKALKSVYAANVNK
jgi:hypothetical protein